VAAARQAPRSGKAVKPEYWKRACRELASRDEVLGGIIRAYRGETLATRGDAFVTLARSIVGQQI
jgi:DNA-3-methyladenine glycosylase II